MTTDIVRFDQFVASAPARIEAAQTADDFKQILTEAKTLAAAARAAKNKEYEKMAKSVENSTLNRLGRLMAAQRDAGLLNKGGGDRKSNHRGKTYPSDRPTFSQAGIDKNLAKAARKAYPEGWPAKSRPQRMTRAELVSAGRSPKAERYYAEDGGSKSRVKLLRDDLIAAKARIVELEAETRSG